MNQGGANKTVMNGDQFVFYNTNIILKDDGAAGVKKSFSLASPPQAGTSYTPALGNGMFNVGEFKPFETTQYQN